MLAIASLLFTLPPSDGEDLYWLISASCFPYQIKDPKLTLIQSVKKPVKLDWVLQDFKISRWPIYSFHWTRTMRVSEIGIFFGNYLFIFKKIVKVKLKFPSHHFTFLTPFCQFLTHEKCKNQGRKKSGTSNDVERKQKKWPVVTVSGLKMNVPVGPMRLLSSADNLILGILWTSIRFSGSGERILQRLHGRSGQMEHRFLLSQFRRILRCILLRHRNSQILLH